MLLTLTQMAERLNRCPKTFRKYVDALDIPHIRLGRDLLFDAAEVTAHLKAQSEIKRERRRNNAPVRVRSGVKSPTTELAKRLGI